jgi:DNA-directed RNA polymerase specialized sigma24 family protein
MERKWREMPYEPDTAMGGPWGRFPQTRHSAIASLGSQDSGERERAWEAVADAYWKPAYKYIRIQWNKTNEEAKDLTQAIFATAFEKDYFHTYDAAKGSFRTFVRKCLDGFVSNQNQAASRLKRGGGALTLPLDFENAEGELETLPVKGDLDTETFFYREWVRHMFTSALEELRSECDGKNAGFELLERYDVERTASSYEQLAREMNLPVTAVTNQLAAARRRFRRIVLDRIRQLTAGEEEFQREAKLLLGLKWR